jgi:hypothetical protein
MTHVLICFLVLILFVSAAEFFLVLKVIRTIVAIGLTRTNFTRVMLAILAWTFCLGVALVSSGVVWKIVIKMTGYNELPKVVQIVILLITGIMTFWSSYAAAKRGTNET